MRRLHFQNNSFKQYILQFRGVLELNGVEMFLSSISEPNNFIFKWSIKSRNLYQQRGQQSLIPHFNNQFLKTTC